MTQLDNSGMHALSMVTKNKAKKLILSNYNENVYNSLSNTLETYLVRLVETVAGHDHVERVLAY